VFSWLWIQVESIEILVEVVHTVVPMKHTVWVEHWNQHEYEVPAEYFSTRIPKLLVNYLDSRNLMMPFIVWLLGVSPGCTLAVISTTFLFSRNRYAR